MRSWAPLCFLLVGCVDFNALDRCFGGACGGDAGATDAGATDAGGAEAPKSCIPQIASGWTHTCARKDDASLWCWGNNNAGQTKQGVAEKVGYSTPLRVYAAGVEAVAAGDSFTCAIVSGKVVCWGFNSRGQLSDGGISKVGPVTVADVERPALLVAGFDHACVLQVAGKVLCWGLNDHGQVGNGSVGDKVTPTHVKIDDVAELAAGFFHTCARKNSGAVVCWGANSSGQRGDTETADRALPGTVVFQGAKRVAAGVSHTCAIKDDGTLWCWGLNNVGQLGDGTFINRSTPKQVPGLSEVVQVGMSGIKIAGEYGHTCARTRDGTVYCWGSNSGGELGTPLVDPGPSPPVPNPTRVPNVEGVSALGVGALHNCAARPGGVFCWGQAGSGQLGNGTLLPSTSQAVASLLTCP
jgi:alpha-tubulin suppressor-like RCC1 family protein